MIEEILESGVPLILDVTNLSENFRRKLYNIAEKANVKFILVRTAAPHSLVKERMGALTSDPLNRSDADWKVYQAMKPRVEKIRYKHLW